MSLNWNVTLISIVTWSQEERHGGVRKRSKTIARRRQLASHIYQIQCRERWETVWELDFVVAAAVLNVRQRNNECLSSTTKNSLTALFHNLFFESVQNNSLFITLFFSYQFWCSYNICILLKPNLFINNIIWIIIYIFIYLLKNSLKQCI